MLTRVHIIGERLMLCKYILYFALHLANYVATTVSCMYLSAMNPSVHSRECMALPFVSHIFLDGSLVLTIHYVV